MGYVEAYVFMFFIATLSSFTIGDPQVPCYFIFGDSLYDNGNNNDLVTEAKVNFPPYGVDFPDGPTGRFSNGRNIADVIAELLGFENSIPPYATVSRKDIVRGVNYASGAAGIRDESGQHMGGRISLNQQIARHAIIILQLIDLIGKGSVAPVQEHLNKCIYTVAMGNNDFINNYFFPQYYNTSSLYTPEEYAEILVQQYSEQLSKLYEFGARKFAVSGAGYAGCAPAMMARYETNVCVDAVNYAVVQFNARLTAALVDLESKLPGAKFIYMEPPLGYSNDFNVTDQPCCKVSTTIGEGQCVPSQVPCNERQNYVFWDAFHPTESISLVDGAAVYAAMSPFYASSTKLSLPSEELLISDA
ncbi:putative triacylglycerol lipase [Helianthus annuus]|uniref:Putative SGNH hydrolase-type esterase domain-containing protein n=1 Tax=Helianthus annuus TaxID=4232 RepID=A0A251VMM2_HELAN|nr:GDSL esterase/lipase At5g45670 [Helianthus annuus]XP_035833464.1 GDSL esterase/lipase At5g45670 [Helianthus annuus]KAF5821028.1 putative triacylglycerol lipase [Helianthus annuus]KAJ0610758.1 putative triacylglycerol lipase [Helianthus annuus]KAJ0621551.1 putative triacylglycerol lipase [Helianthus annuus]KAJ0808828.1 putative triacylglycerol lipase [Helianthus annuus]KAJ0946913.1 putative triacylglycerol lipase [Helianthus annuus]